MGSLEDSFQELAKNMEFMLSGMKGPDYFRSSGPDTWTPALNVYETPDGIVVCVELSGIKPGELDVQIEDQVLHIRGHRPKPVVPDVDEENVGVHVMEIDSGRFHRKIQVPADIDFSASKAQYKHGYVWIVLPRVDADAAPTPNEDRP